MTSVLAAMFIMLAVVCGGLANRWYRTPIGTVLGISTVVSIVLAGVFVVCSMT